METSLSSLALNVSFLWKIAEGGLGLIDHPEEITAVVPCSLRNKHSENSLLWRTSSTHANLHISYHTSVFYAGQ